MDLRLRGPAPAVRRNALVQNRHSGAAESPVSAGNYRLLINTKPHFAV